jgi:hypothetical protein
MISLVRTQMFISIVYLCVAGAGLCHAYSDFASEVVSFKGLFGPSPYDDPNSVLGRPTVWIDDDDWSGEVYACSVVFGAYHTDPNDNKLITTITNGDEIVVKFDHKVADDPGNWYGIDFIVFGNAAFIGQGWWIPADADMERYFLITPAAIVAEPVLVSVAQNSDGPWFSFVNGPYADTFFPTNAFRWNRQAHAWGEQLDWLKPVDPNLSVSDFDGLSAADVIDLYDGSAGGTGFDLMDLAPDDYAALGVDSNTGRKWIQYIKVEFLPDSDYAGEIDGFADVAGCGDYKHPYPVGDISQDCRIDYVDILLLSHYWLTGLTVPNDPAKRVDVWPDDVVDFYDLAVISNEWSACNWQCE